jgi:four helix bundle protein
VVGFWLKVKVKFMDDEIKSYKDLKIWQQGINLVKTIYGETKNYPKEEVYGVVSQIRRATVSVPANIAEGQARGGTKAFMQFLNIAKGSLAELETLMIISRELDYAKTESSTAIEEECQSLTRQITALINRLKSK